MKMNNIRTVPGLIGLRQFVRLDAKYIYVGRDDFDDYVAIRCKDGRVRLFASLARVAWLD